jgi:hypothetical protein
MVTLKRTEVVFLKESVTVAVKAALPTIGVAPDRTPELDSFRPTAARLLWSAGVSDQV